MKGCALSLIMAQAGLYVPAQTYIYGPYQHIFARIITNDDMYRNFSSFTYEMTELSSILKRTGPKTAIFADEICNTTESISALSIVGSTILKLADTHATFVMATHLHDLVNIKKVMNLTNVKMFHLTVEYDNVNDVLIFNRLLKEGSGDSFYGLTIAKYIMKDDAFMREAYNIKNEICMDNDDILPTKVSKYNSVVYMDQCAVCKVKNPKSKGGEMILDTHHINFQCNCDKDGFVIDKSQKKNDKSNLVILCKPCHRKVHGGEINIISYKCTSNGRVIDYEIVSK
jgi:DNA mismatch repair protein MutS